MPDNEEDVLAFDDASIERDLPSETDPEVTHPVHCPYFPEEKYERWRVYIIDKNNQQLITLSWQISTLIKNEEVRLLVFVPSCTWATLQVELLFDAPRERGTYIYTIMVKSDSYIDQEYSKDVQAGASSQLCKQNDLILQFDVNEAHIAASHPQ